MSDFVFFILGLVLGAIASVLILHIYQTSDTLSIHRTTNTQTLCYRSVQPILYTNHSPVKSTSHSRLMNQMQARQNRIHDAHENVQGQFLRNTNDDLEDARDMDYMTWDGKPMRDIVEFETRIPDQRLQHLLRSYQL